MATILPAVSSAAAARIGSSVTLTPGPSSQTFGPQLGQLFVSE